MSEIVNVVAVLATGFSVGFAVRDYLAHREGRRQEQPAPREPFAGLEVTEFRKVKYDVIATLSDGRVFRQAGARWYSYPDGTVVESGSPLDKWLDHQRLLQDWREEAAQALAGGNQHSTGSSDLFDVAFGHTWGKRNGP